MSETTSGYSGTSLCLSVCKWNMSEGTNGWVLFYQKYHGLTNNRVLA